MTIDIGIIGLGYWGQRYVRICNELEDVNLCSCCDRHTVNAIPSGAGFTTNYNDMIENVEAAVISTPASTHYEIAERFLRKGIDILVEKPLALSTYECKTLINLAKQHQSVLAVGHTYLYNPAIRFIKKHITDKGGLYFITANRTHLGLVRDDVDCIWDLAPHDISIANYILDSEPISGHVTKGFYLSKERCDIAFITLFYPDNALCNITVGWLNANKVRKIEFVSAKERIVFDDLDLLEKVKIYKKGVEIVDDRISLRDGEIISPNIKYEEPLKLQLYDFLNAIKTREEPVSNGQVGFKVVKAIEKLKDVTTEKG